MRSTFGSVAWRSKWTPTTFIPAWANLSAAASPNPLEAPKISAQPSNAGSGTSDFSAIAAPFSHVLRAAKRLFRRQRSHVTRQRPRAPNGLGLVSHEARNFSERDARRTKAFLFLERF